VTTHHHRIWIVLALALAGCTAAPSPSAEAVWIRTETSNDATCHLATGEGTLVVDAVAGLGLGELDGRVLHPYWPHGWTALRDGGTTALLDASAQVVAHLGDRVRTSGALSEGDDWLVCATRPVEVIATAQPTALR
jgi:hypothetical protein